MATIKIEAPTIYQVRALEWFGLGILERSNGSFYTEGEFKTMREAKDYLKSVVENHLEAHSYCYDENEIKEKRKEMLNEVKNGMLNIEGATARIYR